MIYDIKELPNRIPVGTELDTRMMIFMDTLTSRMFDDVLLAGCKFQITVPYYKYKTLEFQGNYAIERIFITLEHMNPLTLKSDNGGYVPMYTVHIKSYYLIPSNGTLNRDYGACDLFRLVSPILALRKIFNADGSSMTKQTFIWKAIKSKIDMIVSEEVTEIPSAVYDEVLFEGSSTHHLMASHFDFVEPREINKHLAGMIHRALHLTTDPITRLSMYRPYINSNELLPYMVQTNFIWHSDENFKLPESAQVLVKTQVGIDRKMDVAFGNVLECLYSEPSSYIEMEASGPRPRQTKIIEYCHPFLDGFLFKCNHNPSDAGKQWAMAAFIESSWSIKKFHVVKTWNEEAVLTIELTSGKKVVLVIDLVLLGGVGTTMLLQ